ncbi:hypothetical protein [Bdellovibrio sp. NC01]|uniref:hypothetical protein n=1 Tax=Bdellovibrio sp. NC01 TaxID=2220073 RepID=UPI00115BC8B1|nr:hypothetical protein [Bdellovibrio sp. NC01]QDK38087.1 hypothetical protein DOE51_11060 [Bdellovibrio sp. NC01]
MIFKTNKSIANNKGQTIVEALVGLGLLTVVGFTFTGGMISLRNSTKSAVVLSSTERQINDIAENIKAGVENYQVNFDYKTGTKESLNVDTLPMAWDNGIITTRAQCPKCAGTYGFVIQPLEQYRGLYQVTMRLTHESWKKNNEEFRDYTFVVSAK